MDLYNHHFYWEAHEQLESLWLASKDPIRQAFLKGLIQQAAAGVHWRRGAARSCLRLGWRSLKYLAQAAAGHRFYHGLDLHAWLRRWMRYLGDGHTRLSSPPRLILNAEPLARSQG